MDDEQLKHLALVAQHCYSSYDLAMNCVFHLAQRGAIVPNAVDLFIAGMHSGASG
jgi:hypothetical protein